MPLALYEIVPERHSSVYACLQAFPARKGAERTRTAATSLTPDPKGTGR